MKKFNFLYPLGHDKLSNKQRELIKGFEEDLNFIYARKPLQQFKPKNKKVLKDTGCVIVTYNNLPYLKDLLYDLCYSTALPKDIVIVNNASTDNTLSFLKSFFGIRQKPKIMRLLSFDGKLLTKKIKGVNIHLVTLNKNTGGSGGFASGLFYSKYRLKNKWVFTMDDDIRLPPNLINNIYCQKDDQYAITGIMLNNNTIDKIVDAGSFIGSLIYINFGIDTYSPINRCSYIHCMQYSNVNTQFSVFAFSFFSNTYVSKQILDIISNFFIHSDDIYFFLFNKIVIKNSYKFRYWHKFGESTSFFGWIKFYDVRNAFYLIKNLLPEKLIKSRNRFLNDLKIFLWQSKHQLVNLFIRAYLDGVSGKLGIINYAKKFRWTKIDEYNNNIKKQKKIAIIDYTGSIFQINKVIQEIKRYYPDTEINLFTVTSPDTSVINFKEIIGATKAYFWNRIPSISRLFLFSKHDLFITSFADVPRIFSLTTGKTILMYQEKGTEMLFYKVETSLRQTIKTFLKILQLRYFG